MKDVHVPIIPVNLDGMWGSIFSFERGRFLWKVPRRIPYSVTVSFGNLQHFVQSRTSARDRHRP
jgi:acyl-[acyl-carrier-protein]-phospholipid O-acyltransferase/long-chain-fatty-acid--[acyl-carrier-protein] ligase